MILLLLATGLLFAGGSCALLSGGSGRWATRFGVSGALAGSLLGILPVLRVLAGGAAPALRLPWNVPYGSFSVEIDPLSALFLLLVFLISGAAAIYGGPYLLRAHAPARRHAPGAEAQDHERRSLGPAWFFFNLLTASMVVLLAARNGILFLVAWEVMAVASFFLVTFEDDDESTRDAGSTYLIATHLGTGFLLAMFALLGARSGSLDFDRFGAIGAQAPSLVGSVFLLGVVGFGGKAGLVPFHIWLPEAHPAAPTHVSAVMSGVMIKMGIYGILRLLTFLGTPMLWWGWLLVGLGLLSAVGGALLALAQHDIKRILAYSSIENMGLVATGIGIGLLGLASGLPGLAFLGFTGALLHTVNHSLMKGLLFLGSGAVASATGTRSIDRLGGLLRRMPLTGSVFLIGSIAICGLPPTNGFASEFLLYVGALGGGTADPVGVALPALAAVAGFALAGGFCAVAFAKTFGIVFLGEPRTSSVTNAHDPELPMQLAMGFLAAACLAAGFASPWIVRWIAPVVASVTGLSSVEVGSGVAAVNRPLTLVVLIGGGVCALALAFAALRRALLADRRVERTETWGCGYAWPGPRMQYTGSSFVRLLTSLFSPALGTRSTIALPGGIFPREASLATRTPDAVLERFVRPGFAGVGRGMAKLRWLQHGRLNLYMLYIALTLLILLVWKMR